MKCSCCGQEITSNDRFCPNCGENNEGYVEVIQTSSSAQNSTPHVSQTINRVPINPSQTNQQTNTNATSGSPVFVYSQTQVVANVKPEGKALGICAIIFSVLGGWLGLVLSIVGLCNYKEPENKTLCKIGLGFCIAWFVIGLIIGIASV